MPESADPIPASILEIVRSLLGDDTETGSLLARRIDSEQLARQRLGLFTSVKKTPPKSHEAPASKPARSSISEAVKLRVFRRDRFTCRLCGRRTLYLPVLQAISRALPEEMPYQPSWAFGTTHLVYWTHSTSLEHLTPLARSGLDDESNFVASCYACNSARGDYLLEEVEWRLREPNEASDWDGLSGLLGALVAKYPATAKVQRAGERSVEASSPDVSQQAPEPDVVVPLMTAWIEARTVSPGNLVRVAAEGRIQRRMHRIEAVSGGRATLREMWRENGRWVESRTERPTQLEGEVELVALEAPEPGSES
jgi:5-methylcytosine-specific restriction endonuclease McrA